MLASPSRRLQHPPTARPPLSPGSARSRPRARQRGCALAHRHRRGGANADGVAGQLVGLAGADVRLPVAGVQQRRRRLPADQRRHQRGLHRHRRRCWLHPRGAYNTRQQRALPSLPARRAPDLAPASVVAPSLTGTAAVGQTLTVSPGSWSGSPAPTFAYQWQECNSGGGGCQPISGATNAGYTVTAADVGFTLEALTTPANSAPSPLSRLGALPTSRPPAWLRPRSPAPPRWGKR